MVPELAVRDATLGDVDDLAAIHVRSWQAGYRGIVSDDKLAAMTVERQAERWRRRLAAGRDQGFDLVALRDGRPLGFCSADAGAEPEIVALYIDPSVFRTGVGTALLRQALDRLRDLGAATAVLWMFAANRGAAAFYSRFGFEPDGAAQERMPGVGEIRLTTRL